MLKSSIAKAILGCGAATGVACAIGFSVTKETRGSAGSLISSESFSSDQGEIESNRTTWDTLGEKVTQNYSNSQTTGNNNDEDLVGKEDLKEIIDINSNPSNGNLSENKWKSCKSPTQGSSTYCGYLVFDNPNYQYKLKIVYETGVPKSLKDSGTITVARATKNSSGIDYYNSTEYDQKLGSHLGDVKFDQLKSFENSENRDSGTKMSGISIKKELEGSSELKE